MDAESQAKLAQLLRRTRIAALGTLHEGAPNLAMMAVAAADDFSAFYIHISKLGKHTGDMEKDPRVSLLFTETDDGRADPQTLARLSLAGTAALLAKSDPATDAVRHLYLERFPEAEQFFQLGDFNLWRITPLSGRFVAGFARAFNIVPDALVHVSKI